MPQNTRALTRAARRRAAAKAVNYTTALADVVAIQERADTHGETFDEAEAQYDDPANKLLCETCGWTVGMTCPECVPGCGCATGCSGWRHAEYTDDGGDGDGYGGCFECGAAGPSYRCNCGNEDDDCCSRGSYACNC